MLARSARAQVKMATRLYPVRIHLYHKLPTPYNDMLFRALDADCRADLNVYHLWRRRDNRPWTVELATGYQNHYLETRVLGVDFSLLKIAISERNSFFLVGDWAHVSSIVILVSRILLGAPVSLWTDTPQQNLWRAWPKKLLRQFFLNWLLPRVDVIFGTGEPALSVLQDMGVATEKLVNLPCFVDLDLPERAQSNVLVTEKSQGYRNRVGCSSSGIIFMIAGTCVHYKGQDVALKAFAQMMKKCDLEAGLLIVGDGPTRGELEELADGLGISDRVAFLGWLDPEDMDAAYAACDVVVNSSRRDAFPLVILEGMNWGKVVIGSDICGSVQDRIVNGKNGFAFQSENIAALSDVMTMVAADPQLRQKVGQEARVTAELWPVQIGVEKIIETAQQVLKTE